MSQVCTASHLSAMGCPGPCQSAIAQAGLPSDMLEAMRAVQGFSWTGLAAFVQKHAADIPALVADFAPLLTGGPFSWALLIPLVVKYAQQLPGFLADFLAIFGQTVPTPAAP